jgi:peptide-methionine (S)-S-oxide reductase
VAKEVLAEARAAFSRPVVTELMPAPPYWRAEDEHQEYFSHHPHQGYCAAVIGPKVAKFKKTFSELRKAAA